MPNKLIITLLLFVFLTIGTMIVWSCGDDDDDDNDDNDNEDDDDTTDDDDSDDTFSVPADDSSGLDTGIDVAAGDTLTIEASGTITLDSTGLQSTPDGLSYQTCDSQDCPMPGQPLGGLVGLVMEPAKKADDDGIINCLFWIGSYWGQSSACGGRLVLVVNDHDYTDNYGKFDVLVTKGTASGYTWTDSDTGLEWEKTSHSSENYTYEEAIEFCDTLTLDDKSDWRLPTISELRTLIRGCDGTVTGGDCAVTDDCASSDCFNQNSEACTGCEEFEGPTDGCYWVDKIGGDCSFNWSITSWSNPEHAWGVNFSKGAVGVKSKENSAMNDAFVRCVR